MEFHTKKIGLVALTFCCTHAQKPTELYGHSFFSPRSQSSNSARQLVGQHPYMHRHDMDKCYGTFSATLEYLHSYKTHRIAEHFFGVDTLRFSGSQVTTRGDDDILADYFGLSPAFDSLLSLDPKVTTFLVDFNLYAGFDGFCPGLYLQVIAPAVWTRHRICLDEQITDNGSDLQFPALYMDDGAIDAPIKSAKLPFQEEVTYGQVQEGLKYGKIGCCEEGKMSDIIVALGWDFLRRDHGHVGLNLRMAAPTGTRPRGVYMFEPIVGNGRHWEFGVGLNGEAILWEKDGDKTVSMIVEANFTHMFKSRQCRSFDFCRNGCQSSDCCSNGFGSRFILLKEFDDAGEYTGKCLPAINKTTLPCDVSTDIKVDGTLMASYHSRNWTCDLGYNGFIRSREKVCIIGKIEINRYGMKGIQNVAVLPGPTPDNNTQSSATLHGNTLDPAVQASVADPSPVFIKTSDLDPNSAAMERYISHKFFTYFSYSWNHNDDQRTIPYLGIGLEIEFEGVKECVSRANKITLSQVGVMAKAGVAF